MFCTTVLSIGFGFVQNYWTAFAIRLAIGLTAPIGVVSKTCVTEISPPSFQPAAAALYASSWLLGSVVGSVVGGLLVDPKSTGLAPSGFFSDWPYLLPNLFTAVVSFLSFIGVWIWLKETLKKKDPLLNQTDSPPTRTMMEMAKDPLILLLALQYGLNSFINTSYNELFPLWCWADKSKGGLDFSPADIGWALAASNIVLIIGSQLTFKRIVKHKGLKWCSIWGSVYMIPVAFVIPWISYANSEAGIWIYIIVMTFVFYLLNFTVLTSQIVMSNNCVLKHERGKLNGLYMFVGSAARALAPAVMGVVFSATTDSGEPFPVDYTFCFSLLAVGSLLMWFFSRRIPQSVEKAKETFLPNVRSTSKGAIEIQSVVSFK
jgi:MFS family permease